MSLSHVLCSTPHYLYLDIPWLLPQGVGLPCPSKGAIGGCCLVQDLVLLRHRGAEREEQSRQRRAELRALGPATRKFQDRPRPGVFGRGVGGRWEQRPPCGPDLGVMWRGIHSPAPSCPKLPLRPVLLSPVTGARAGHQRPQRAEREGRRAPSPRAQRRRAPRTPTYGWRTKDTPGSAQRGEGQRPSGPPRVEVDGHHCGSPHASPEGEEDVDPLRPPKGEDDRDLPVAFPLGKKDGDHTWPPQR